MKLITLNTWAGKLYGDISRFLKDHSSNVDVFCLQEVLDGKGSVDAWDGAISDLYGRIGGMLPGFNGRVGEMYTTLGERLAIFSSEKISVTDSGEITLCDMQQMEFKGKTYGIGSRMQWIGFAVNGKRFTVCNVHGLWTPTDKADNPERILQSERILKFLDEREGEAILCGDLNLAPDTESVLMLEGKLRNLVMEHNVPTTRNKFTPEVAGKFADYVFISKGVRENSFDVLQDTVSDHLPLLLDFD
ncbi:MAG TPA: endonuclease/exonuclease/phosphatase family protein [Candidatus Baltobacteraceae bacterium]|nr:endonuclease/exonuclease/phosphatase family protein [Candidatus Baltobacteraceae bacterium]